MKISKVFLGTVVDVDHFDTSKMGNPRCTLTIQDGSGSITTLYTQIDSDLGYTAIHYLRKYVNYTTCLLRGKLCIDSIYIQGISAIAARKFRDKLRNSL